MKDQINAHLKAMDDLDFEGWNNADWQGVFAHQHTDDVYVDFKGRTHAWDRGAHRCHEGVRRVSRGHAAKGRVSPNRFRVRRVDLRRRRVRRREPHGDRRQVARRRDRRGVHLDLGVAGPWPALRLAPRLAFWQMRTLPGRGILADDNGTCRSRPSCTGDRLIGFTFMH